MLLSKVCLSLIVMTGYHTTYPTSLSTLTPVVKQETNKEEVKNQIDVLKTALQPVFNIYKSDIEKIIVKAKQTHKQGVVITFTDDDCSAQDGLSVPFQVLMLMLYDYFDNAGYMVSGASKDNTIQLQITWDIEKKPTQM